MKSVIVFLLFTLVIILSPSIVASAEPFHMTLLAAQELNSTLIGSTADLYLEVQPGRGRVFLETFPLTKVDTQISTRFAKEIACHYFDLSCSSLDFIYTIQSDSVIIGGPSAGAALAALTTAAVTGDNVNQSVAVTGTINSGGLIGPVGGIKAKIDAAAHAKLKKVLIPIGMRVYNQSQQNEGTGTIDLIEYGDLLDVQVVEVSNLNEVLFHFTNQKIIDSTPEFEPLPQYVELMKDVSEQLCTRSSDLVKELNKFHLNQSERDEITNRTSLASSAAKSNSYYSAASYCFALNIYVRNELYEKQKLSLQKIKAKSSQLENDMLRFEREIRERELTTITDLQAFAVVLERLHDAQQALEDATTGNIFRLAFAEERFFSARAWSTFFALDGREYVLSDAILQRSCIEKLQEAKERDQYVQLFSAGIDHINGQIERADEQRKQGDYVLCLIIASQAKADANAILSTIGIERSELPRLIAAKLEAIETLIARTIENQAFPLLGFSYYEYALSLKDHDESSALLYSEYSLEMSNLDIYFEEARTDARQKINFDYMPFVFGFFLGLAVASFVVFLRRKKKRNRKATKP
ncbi:MAG TPA: S16 family serine protease [Candidatus Nanoarchaeia archaeon]|nr:S16 family serine protease [Candidatus Nanoarchaeia archaeon]